ncbi:MAG: histidine phosphotransferase [Rhodobacteraceae bacterium]|nr:histidine phosphotransferase [Paracoccaceae bacterium]
MLDGSTTLATALGSRICHDLTSPLGAIQNGLELLTLSPDVQMGPELELVQQSAQAAVAKIRFFRLAFGQSGGDGSIASGDLAAVLAAPGGPPRLSFAEMPTDVFSRSEAQKLCLGVLCLATLAPTGGVIQIDRSSQGLGMVLTPTRPIDTEDMEGLISENRPAASEPSKIHFEMLLNLIGDTPTKGFSAQSDGTVHLILS